MSGIKNYIIQHVDPVEFYKSFFPEWTGNPTDNVKCPFHKDGQENTPSLSLDPETGKAFCHACNWKASSIVGFYHDRTKTKKTKFSNSCIDMYSEYCEPIIPESTIKSMEEALYKNEEACNHITGYRGLDLRTIKKYRLGLRSGRIVIPIQNRFGMWVDCRKRTFNPKDRRAKVSSWKRGYGGARLFPIQVVFENNNLILCEGEWDALLLNRYGFHAFTVTGGAGTWKEEFTKYLHNKRVAIIFDNDPAGKRGAEKVANKIAPIASLVKIVELSFKGRGKDVSDWLLDEGSAAELQQLITKTKSLPKPSDILNSEDDLEIPEVPLSLAANAKYVNRIVKVKATIAGKAPRPYAAAEQYVMLCGGSTPFCATCPRAEKNYETIDTLDLKGPAVLSLIGMNDVNLARILADNSLIPAPRKCQPKYEVKVWKTIEEVILMSEVGTTEANQEHVVRLAYYIGHSLEVNRSYELTVMTVADPKTQHSAHLILKAQILENDISTFELSEEDLYAVIEHSRVPRLKTEVEADLGTSNK